MKYYWFDKTVKSHTIQLSNTLSNESDNKKVLQFIPLHFDEMKIEGIIDEKWFQLGDVQHFIDLDNNPIFFLAFADWNGFSSSRLWKHVIDVFIHNWQWIFDDIEQSKFLDIPSPSDARQNVDYHWSTSAVSCCRVLEESGFDTGYGDPYESEVLFDVISNMSASYYEKRECEGSIIPLGCNEEPDISFVDPISIDLDNCRILRKFLEMARDGLALAAKGNEITGLVSSANSDGRIVISGMNQWRFYKNDVVLFSVCNGRISVSASLTDDKEIFADELRNSIQNSTVIEEIAKVAAHQFHGTVIMFTDEAEAESIRLSEYHRCELIKPIDLYVHKEYVVPITSIDGAIIVDYDGKCYGVGAILDGEAVKPGNIGRGARFNSAMNYVAWRKIKSPGHQYCAVIISEDGLTNVITSETVDLISEDLQ